MDCTSFILTVLNESGGSFESATKLQKLAFLSIYEGGARPFTKFIWYRYGPYSKEIQATITSLESSDFIKVRELNRKTFMGDSYTIRKIVLTAKGRSLFKTVSESLSTSDKDVIGKTVFKYADKPLSSILDYVYHAYSPDDLKR